MSEKRKAINLLSMSKEKRNDIINDNTHGIGGATMNEPIPKYLSTPCEEIIQNKNGAFIVLGRDRPEGPYSGYGGKGYTGAASIDLVVGRQSFLAKEVDSNDKNLYTNNNFELDAARIYISQTTDIDENFDLAKGSEPLSKTRSSVGIKADTIRIMSREDIKLVTNVGNQNSQGGGIDSVKGIQLIAGNQDDGLEPIPKGDQLVLALESIYTRLEELTGQFEAFVMYQKVFNTAVTSHTHISSTPGSPVVPSVELFPIGISNEIMTTVNNMMKLQEVRLNFEMSKFSTLHKFGSKYLNSRHNKVT